MTKQEALQTFSSHVDIAGLKNDFPDIDWVITELEDGQQEIIIRLQGADPDFHPSADIAVIDAMTVNDITMFSVKNEGTLEKEKRITKRQRIVLRDNAIFKRVRQILLDAGLKPRKALKIVKERLAAEEVE